MNRVVVKRIRQGNNSTLSEIYIDDVLHCYGLEDLVRDVKINRKTTISQGVYPLALNT